MCQITSWFHGTAATVYDDLLWMHGNKSDSARECTGWNENTFGRPLSEKQKCRSSMKLFSCSVDSLCVLHLPMQNWNGFSHLPVLGCSCIRNCSFARAVALKSGRRQQETQCS